MCGPSKRETFWEEQCGGRGAYWTGRGGEHEGTLSPGHVELEWLCAVWQPETWLHRQIGTQLSYRNVDLECSTALWPWPRAQYSKLFPL